MLEGMAEIAEQIFDLPIRRGTPAGVGGLADHVNSPAFATAVGLVMYAHRNHVGELARPVGAGAFGRVAGRLRTLFKEFLLNRWTRARAGQQHATRWRPHDQVLIDQVTAARDLG